MAGYNNTEARETTTIERVVDRVSNCITVVLGGLPNLVTGFKQTVPFSECSHYGFIYRGAARPFPNRLSHRKSRLAPAAQASSIHLQTTAKPATRDTVAWKVAPPSSPGRTAGLVRAVALCFAKEGADILFAFLEGDADEKKDAEDTVSLIEATGRKVVACPGDIRQKTFCQALVKRAIDELGRLDILVNNAAFQRTYAELSEIPEEEFDRTYRTNVYGTFFLTQAALPEMKPGGVILNSCSIEAFEPKDQLAPYASTKAALASLTKSFAKLCMRYGVRVNGVAPGPAWTPLIPATMPEDNVKTFGENTLFKRPAQPVELAAVFLFLASDDASYVTGRNLRRHWRQIATLVSIRILPLNTQASLSVEFYSKDLSLSNSRIASLRS